jgi:hypothetical protein
MVVIQVHSLSNLNPTPLEVIVGDPTLLVGEFGGDMWEWPMT